jgi:DNA polymerase
MAAIRMSVQDGADLEGFRGAVRALVERQAPPDDVLWSTANDNDLFGAPSAAAGDAPAVSLPRDVGELIRLAICHSDPERFALLYQLVWRVLHGERHLLEVQSDPLVHRLQLMAKSVRRDIHKMHAFLRFRETHDPDGTERFVAWFEPEHHILDAAVPFFVERFRGMIWSILTPQGSRHWDRETLVEAPPATKADAPDSDAFEAAWKSYYESIFNPARVNPAAMRQHMPKKYWRNLPEAAAISDLVREAPIRAREMIEREAAMPTRRDPKKAVAAMAEQEPKSLKALNALIAASEPLTPGADHAVLGEGPIGADIAFVGEQPGDQEDLEGKPFIGPAGQMLDKAMAEVGIDRRKVYVTNAVKHFKFEPRGKRRIHKKPNPGEVKRYRWWLMKELEFVHPKLVVALGGTALLGLTGKPLPVTRSRGPMRFGEFPGYVTVHPSYLLRIPDEDSKKREYAAFEADLRRIKKLAGE